MPNSLTPFGDGRTRIVTGASAEAELDRLALPGDIVRDGIEHGAGTARAASTSDYPRTYAGIRMWSETGAAIINQAYALGWEREHCGGVAPLVNRTLGLAIIVTAGDGCTGDERYDPDVRYERPELVRAIVRGELNTLLSPAPEDWDVYFLLHYVGDQDPERGFVPAELSRPEGLDGEGRVTRWRTRILIPAGGTGDDGVGRRTAPPPMVEPPSPAVTIRRRAS